MPIILTVSESSSQLISGIPEYVEFDTSVPATVFYTLDGTTPSEDSYMASGEVYLPSDQTSVVLMAVAVSGDISSGIFEEEYEIEQAPLSRGRVVEGERITVLGYGDDPVNSLSVDYAGDDAQSSSVNFQDLEIKVSDTDRHGYSIPGGTSHDMVNFPEIDGPARLSPYQGESSSVNSNVDFDPTAGLILVDGSTDESFANQEVRIINRTNGTFGVFGGGWNEHLNNRHIVSGNFVRSMYNPANNKIVSYYYESRENRWLESVQSVSLGSKKLTPKRREGGGTGLVFRWLDSRSLSKLF